MEPLNLPDDIPEILEPVDPLLTPISTRKAFTRVGLGLTACLLGGSLLLVAVVYLLELLGVSPDAFHQDVLLLLNTLCVDVGGKLLAILFMHKLPDSPMEKKSLSAKAFFTLAAMAYGLMLLGNYMGTGLMLLVNAGAENPLSSVVTLESCTLLTVLDLILFAPVLEELLFRKLLVKKIARWGEVPAMVFSGLAFALFHGNFYQFFYAFFLGMLLAHVYLSTRRILYPILLHAFVNTLGSVVPLGLMAVEAYMSVSLATILDTVVSLVLLGLGIAGIVLLVQRRKKAVFIPCPEKGLTRWMYLNAGTVFFLLVCLVLMVASTFGISIH